MKKVLTVDDAAFIRLTLRNILEKLDYVEVHEAASGSEALHKYKELKPDLVTMDITMSDMTGIEALKRIREFDEKAKIIIISALGEESMVKEAVLAGAISFIVKPFREEYVFNTAKKVLGI